ncbi:hypothetical protein KI387_035635 [Taxus chinensis]|uniref:AAA+ ATPase domain-containing protein n=1 Tax=Taxus chinensis TaxID=29808 RepID=A0AA38FPM8_TAXCH|nr:hypothetical protein KI387_035635 [Taxus chinensis]
MLDLQGCNVVVTLPTSVAQLKSLTFLVLNECSNLITLPETFGNLSALQLLYLSECSKLATLPPTFGQLKSLVWFDMEGCEAITTLPDSFGNLSALIFLNLDRCSNLSSLPESLSQLSCLKYLRMGGCERLTKLPNNFGELKSLKFLLIEDCSNLKTLNGDFGSLASLMALKVSNCESLDGEAVDILVKMKSLMFVKIYGSERMIERWKEIGQHYPLIVTGDDESRFVVIDGDSQLMDMSFFPRELGEEKEVEVAVLFTMCNLSLDSNIRALQAVMEELEKRMKKTHCSGNFHIVYAGAGEQSYEHIRQMLLLLPRCSCACIPADNKTRQLFNFAVYKLFERGSSDAILSSHTCIVGLRVGLQRDNRQVKFRTDCFPRDDKEETRRKEDLRAMNDQRGGLKGGQQNTAAQETGSSSRFASYTNFGKNLVEVVLKRAERNRCTACLKSSFNRETRKVVIDVLKEASQIHSLAAGLCVVGYLLDQIDQISNNMAQCVQLLRYLCAMARRVKQLDDRLPAEREQLSQAVDFIFKGCLLCLRLLKSQRLSRLFCASVDAGDLQNLESQIKHTYQDLTLGAVIGVLDNMPRFHPPTQGEDPSAVGIEEAKYRVIRLLKMDPMDESKRAVVLYGVGGVGKTTLASSVFKSLDLKGYKFCRLDMDQICSSDHIKQLQQQILGDLFRKRISLRSSVDGQNELAKAFREASDEAIFMFIDNALAQRDLTKLLPQDLSCLPRSMRMLLTTRRLDQTNILLRTDFQGCEFRVDSLSSFDSKKLLCKIVLGSADASFPEGIESRDVDEIVEMCGGIPLIIELVGPKLKRCIFNDGSAVKALKESLKETLMEGEKSEMSERVVDSVFNSLDERCKEAFLDVVCFFIKSDRDAVSNAVGKAELEALEDAALVKLSVREELA